MSIFLTFKDVSKLVPYNTNSLVILSGFIYSRLDLLNIDNKLLL